MTRPFSQTTHHLPPRTTYHGPRTTGSPKLATRNQQLATVLSRIHFFLFPATIPLPRSYKHIRALGSVAPSKSAGSLTTKYSRRGQSAAPPRVLNLRNRDPKRSRIVQPQTPRIGQTAFPTSACGNYPRATWIILSSLPTAPTFPASKCNQMHHSKTSICPLSPSHRRSYPNSPRLRCCRLGTETQAFSDGAIWADSRGSSHNTRGLPGDECGTFGGRIGGAFSKNKKSQSNH
jgi:hypothetical protein